MKKFTTVKNLASNEVATILADNWAKVSFREYIFNERNKVIDALRSINTKTIEGDALELQRGKGRVEAIEWLIKTCQNCYEKIEKINIQPKTIEKEVEESDAPNR